MTQFCFELRPELPGDTTDINLIHEAAFGPGRFARTAFRLREGVLHESGLSFVAVCEGRLIGSVRLTGINIGPVRSLLLGPLAVRPDYKNQSVGKSLVSQSLKAAEQTEFSCVLLVGDLPYYGPLGFSQVQPGSIAMPGPVDPNRLLMAELRPGAASDAVGEARGG